MSIIFFLRSAIKTMFIRLLKTVLIITWFMFHIEIHSYSKCHYQNYHIASYNLGLPLSLSGKESTFSAGDLGSISGSWSFPGGGHDNSLHYSCPKNPMVRGVWWAIVLRVAKSRTWLNRLSTHTHTACNLMYLPPHNMSYVSLYHVFFIQGLQ